MRKTILSIGAFVAISSSIYAADVTAKISGVHLCCGKCVAGAEKAVGTVPGATATVTKESGTVEIKGASADVVQKAADALVAGGFFGKSDNPAIKLNASSGADSKQVQSVKVGGVHLCCDKCAKAAHEAVASVAGVKGDTAAKNVTSFEVTGDFKANEVFDALHKAGLAGKAEK